MKTRMLTTSVSLAKSAWRRASPVRVIRNASAWIIIAPPTQTAAATTCTDLKNVYQVTGNPSLEEFLQLHRGAHVSFDLELAGHVGARRVLLAARDLLERLLGGRDRHVAVAGSLGDFHGAVLNVDLPRAGALDVEHVGVVHPGSLRCVDTALERVEELPRAHGSNPTSVAGSSFRARRAGGRRTVSGTASIGAAAATRRALRRLVASARLPSATAATPPSPTESPITRPDAVPTWRGRYSWPITIVTPNVPTTHMPISASAKAPGMPPTRTNTSTSGPVAATLPSRIGFCPKRAPPGASRRAPA